MSDPSSPSLGRRALGLHMLRAAALLGLRSVGGAQALSVLAGCADTPARDDAVDTAVVPLTHVAADAVVVGTGYGGAVVAKRLAEKGVSVLMLEMGRLWDTPGPDGKVFCAAAKPDGRAMWFRDKLVLGGLMPIDIDIPVDRQAGILDVVQSPNMNVYCGRGVGGGSLVNMAMLVTPPRDVFSRTLPTVEAEAMFGTYYPRALAMLRGNTVRRAFWESTPWYQYSRVGHAAATAAGFDAQFLTSGYDYAYMEQEAAGSAPASALGGEAGFGNNHGKQSVDKNYLADALATGNVAIHSLHIVREVRREADGKYLVEVNVIDVAGKLVARKAITCAHLFLCGGSMGTSQLLTRARETGTLPDLNEAVGTEWGPNSDIFTVRGNPLWSRGKELLDDTTYHPVGDVERIPKEDFRL